MAIERAQNRFTNAVRSCLFRCQVATAAAVGQVQQIGREAIMAAESAFDPWQRTCIDRSLRRSRRCCYW